MESLSVMPFVMVAQPRQNRIADYSFLIFAGYIHLEILMQW